MLKKLLAIAMIGTAMVASAEVPMEFRDGLITNPDFGGHFFTYYDEATGVTTYKSIHAGTTYTDILKYCEEELNNSQLSNLNIDAWKELGGGMDENGFWKNHIADPTAGPRYMRTKRTADNSSWESHGMTSKHKYLAFEYKTNTPYSGFSQVVYQEPQEATAAEITMTVSDEWQTCVIATTPSASWITGAGKKYIWLYFDGWSNSQDEIIIEVKNLRFATAEEVGLEPEPVLPGTEPGEVELPVTFGWTAAGTFHEETNAWGDPYYLLNGGDGNRLISQSFIGTVPESATILELDYKSSETIPNIVIYLAAPGRPNIEGIQTPLYAGAGIIPIVMEPFEATDYSVIDVPEEGWVHKKYDLTKGMPGVHQGDFTKAHFAPTPNSGDYLWIQAVGAPADTEFYLRNVTLNADPSGIQGVGADEESEVVSSEFFDLQGRQLKAAPESGLYLRRDLRANGTSTTVKAIR